MTDDFPAEDERFYDLHPDSETDPWPPGMYEGTGIGALYGISPMTAEQAASLRGWTVGRGRPT